LTRTGPCGRTGSGLHDWTSFTATRTIRDLLPFELALAPDEDGPLHVQIREQLRQAILQRRLPAGRRLPSSRILAQHLACARGTVLLALEQLAAEGYVETHPGAGTFVARDLPEELLHAPALGLGQSMPGHHPLVAKLSSRAAALLGRPSPSPWLMPVSAKPRAFALGRPAPDAFPFELWAKLLEAEWRDPPGGGAEPPHPFGDARLRHAIAAYLASARGFACDPATVVVTSGVREALSLLAHLLLDPGEPVWVEEPGFAGVLGALTAAGLRPVPIRVDQGGFPVAAALDREPAARMVVVTPAHQYPLGVTMTLARRLALLQWAEAADGWIVEDDYDGEYRYAGRPLAPLRALDRSGRVAYVGSFSKVLFPSLRLGYLILPAALVTAAERLLVAHGASTTSLGQAALARFVTEGHFAAHLRRTRRLYAERQAVLVDEARRHLEGLLTVAADPAGMHLIARPSGTTASEFDDEHAAHIAAGAGISVVPLSRHYAEGAGEAGLLLGYAALTPGTIRAAITLLATVLRRGISGGSREFGPSSASSAGWAN
jgi:GntR family transcriptional regulator/MocR family aminotransferase